MGSEDEKKKTYVQIDPQQDSETYCICSCEKRDGKKKERKKERKEKERTDILHRFCKRITRCCQGLVDIFFACDLIAHFDSFIVENLVGFLDLFGGVVCWHFSFFFFLFPFPCYCYYFELVRYREVEVMRCDEMGGFSLWGWNGRRIILLDYIWQEKGWVKVPGI